MRSSLVACMLLAAIVLTTAKERPKRDFTLLKKIASNILGIKISNEARCKENFKLYKIPGFDILVKAIPKVCKSESAVPVPETVALQPGNTSAVILKSYLGAKSRNATLEALKKIETLLKLEILGGKQDEQLQELVALIIPRHTKIKYVETETNERIAVKSPVMAGVREPVYVVPTLGRGYKEAVDIVNRRPVAVDVLPRSVFPGQIKVSQVIESTVPTKYSYKQTSQDGTVTTYASEDNPNVVTTRIGTMPALPPYIKLRFQEVAAISVNSPSSLQPIPAFPIYSQPRPSPVNYTPRTSTISVNENSGEVRKEAYNTPSPVISKYTYKQINHNSPDTFTVVEVGDKTKVNVDTGNKINSISDFETIPKIFMYVPPTSGQIEPFPIKITRTDARSYQTKNETNPGVNADNIENNVLSLMSKIGAQNIPALSSINRSFNHNPIVVPDDEIFVYPQNNSGDSSISVTENVQDIVSVNVYKSRNIKNQVGTDDISDAIY